MTAARFQPSFFAATADARPSRKVETDAWKFNGLNFSMNGSWSAAMPEMSGFSPGVGEVAESRHARGVRRAEEEVVLVGGDRRLVVADAGRDVVSERLVLHVERKLA